MFSIPTCLNVSNIDPTQTHPHPHCLILSNSKLIDLSISYKHIFQMLISIKRQAISGLVFKFR